MSRSELPSIANIAIEDADARNATDVICEASFGDSFCVLETGQVRNFRSFLNLVLPLGSSLDVQAEKNRNAHSLLGSLSA